MDNQSNELKKEFQELKKEIQEMRKENFQIQELKKEIQELKKEIQESRNENIQIKSKVGSLGTTDYLWWCFEELGEKLDKDSKALKEEIKEEIVMYSKE